MHIRGTTILAVKKNNRVTVAGDGQVTLDTTILKHGARKVRRLYNDEVVSALPEQRLTHLRCSIVLIRSSSIITATC
jgi:hypothetical protein